jgi:iron complex outermembrane receptor protein
VIAFRVSRELGAAAQIHLKTGHRTRFPSLRELYSGALGKFEPNPDLAAETLDSIELGGGFRSAYADLAVDLFAQRMREGIVRVSLENGKLQRRNEERIRTLGFEVSGSLYPGRGVRIDAHHSILHARARAGGFYSARVEGPASFSSFLSVSQSIPAMSAGVGTLRWVTEVELTGERWSLDANLGELVRVRPTTVWNLRLGWVAPVTSAESEVYVRINNLFDHAVYSQVGLPEAGREIRGGVRVKL